MQQIGYPLKLAAVDHLAELNIHVKYHAAKVLFALTSLSKQAKFNNFGSYFLFEARLLVFSLLSA